MEGRWYTSFGQLFTSQLALPKLEIYLKQFTLFLYCISDSYLGSSLAVWSQMGRYLMSQFFCMNEQNLFLTLFQGLPDSCLLISDQRRPISEQSLIIFRSYQSVQSSLLILGSSLLMNLSLICLPVLVPSIQESTFQFLPTFFMSFLMDSSSSVVHIFLWSPSWVIRLQRCRHWFWLRSCMREAISAHFLGCRLQRSSKMASSSCVQVFTLLFLECVRFCFISMLTLTPSCLQMGILYCPKLISSIIFIEDRNHSFYIERRAQVFSFPPANRLPSGTSQHFGLKIGMFATISALQRQLTLIIHQ